MKVKSDANDALTGLSTAAARRIVQTGKYASGEKASKAEIKKLAEKYDIKVKGSGAAEPKPKSDKTTPSVKKGKATPMPVSPSTKENQKTKESSTAKKK